MFRMIDGPRGYISTRADGPYAFCEESALSAYNTTEWLLEYAKDAVENHGTSWDDFGDAYGILGTYVLKFENDETGEVFDQELNAADITQRGVQILNAAAKGEDVEVLLKDWRDNISAEANYPK